MNLWNLNCREDVNTWMILTVLNLPQQLWKKEIEKNTWAWVNMEYLFGCLTQCLTVKCSKRVGYKLEHRNRYFISMSNKRFPTTLEDFQRFSNYCLKSPWMFPNNFQKVLKITKDCWRLPRNEDVSITHPQI